MRWLKIAFISALAGGIVFYAYSMHRMMEAVAWNSMITATIANRSRVDFCSHMHPLEAQTYITCQQPAMPDKTGVKPK